MQPSAAFRHRLPLAILLPLMLLTAFGPALGQDRVIRRQAPLLELPHTEAVVLEILVPGMPVELVQQQGAWARVRLPGTAEVGWVELGALAPPPVQPAGKAPVPEAKLGGMEQQVRSLDQDLQTIERRVDELLNRIEGRGSHPGLGALPEAGQAGPRPVGEPPVTNSMEGPAGAAVYGWRNSFFAGSYFRGGENCYGLGLARRLDRGGRNWLEMEGAYSLGAAGGTSDDFLDWSLGLSFNLMPQRYRIYPFLGAQFGMRHLLGDLPGTRRFFLLMPAVGLNAELSSIFMLAVRVQGAFLFDHGDRYDEGRVSLSAGYRY